MDSKMPLLFFLGELSGETNHALFDPVSKKLYNVEIPDLESQVECLAAKFGWLLLVSRDNCSLFFFNPLTKQKIQLPYRNSYFNAAAFSAPPTSPNCTVYVVVPPTFDNNLYVDTFSVNHKDRTWIRYRFKAISRDCNVVVQALVYNNELYCVDSHGRVAIFNAEKYKWSRVPNVKDKAFGNICNPFLVEFDGHIYAGKKGCYGVIDKMYKLNLDNGVADWVEVEDSVDFNFFFGPYGSCAKSSSTVEGIENQIYLAGEDPNSKCVVYNLDKKGEFKEEMKFYIPTCGWCHTPVWIDRSS